MTFTPTRSPRRATDTASRTDLVLRSLAAAALGVSAFVHLDKAHVYNYGSTITGTELFYAQGAVAALVAVWLLVRGGRAAWAAAAIVGAASFGAVMLYQFVNVGSLGPVPNMYDPVWYAEKALSAIAEAVVVVLWLVHEITARRERSA